MKKALPPVATKKKLPEKKSSFKTQLKNTRVPPRIKKGRTR